MSNDKAQAREERSVLIDCFTWQRQPQFSTEHLVKDFTSVFEFLVWKEKEPTEDTVMVFFPYQGIVFSCFKPDLVIGQQAKDNAS